jgi:hypothetical protein
VIQKEKAQFKLKPNMKVEGFWHEKARVFANNYSATILRPASRFVA